MTTIHVYKLRKNFRMFNFTYYKVMEILEISLYFWSIIIIFGSDKNGKIVEKEDKNNLKEILLYCCKQRHGELAYFDTELAISKIQSLKQIDWHFIMHTIAIVSRSFVKAKEAIEILKKEGIFKLKRRK